ncbi:MAG: S-layer homology domain-containing protein [Cyanobacteria bacterium P01_A01_bin.114]
MVQTTASVFYINPASGNDQNAGTAQAPLKSITRALRQAQSGARLQLEAGVYQSETGEQFPIKIPTGVTVSGQGGTVLITGGGAMATAEFGQQQITLVLADRAQLRGVTVTNPLDQGIGVWIERGSPILVRNRLVKCRRDGVYVTGNALPIILENEFIENAASGLFMVRQAKGEVRQNIFRKTGYGIALSDQAAPLLVANQVIENKAGIVISRSARPVLRQNRVENNQTVGLWVQDSAAPDLGHSQDPGKNTVQHNAEWNLRSDVRAAVTSAGNQLNPNTVRGRIAYAASELPDPVAIPEILLGRVVPEPQPKTAAPKSSPDPINLDSRFTDLVGHWAAPFGDALAENGLVRGFLDGSFRPDLTVTRAQFAALVVAAFPNQASDNRRVKPFVDVSPNFWAREVIYRAQAQGFLSGFPDNTFRPDAPMTRVQALVALVSGLRLGAGQSSQLGVYQDRAQIPSYAIDAVAAATQRQMVVNHPVVERLRPMEPITRAETVALVYQALAALGKMPSLPSPFVVRPLDAMPNDVIPNFDDLARHWASDFIEQLSAKNIISGFGDGRFQPDSPMTRAQFAALVVKAYQPKLQRLSVGFRDVPPDFWAAGAIETAYRAKFLSGFPDLTFAPDHPVLKLQVLLALVSGLDLGQSAASDLLNRYRDRHRIPTYAQGAIATATQLGLVFNYPDLRELHPTRIASRAEVAAMVYQGLVVLKKAKAIASPYQVTV